MVSNTTIDMVRTVLMLLAVGFYSLIRPCSAVAAAAGETVAVDDSSHSRELKWFRSERSANLAAVGFFSILVLVLVYRGRKGKIFYIRPIAGLSAIEEAVGRAAEMGRPISYVPGLSDISDPATVAAMSVLSRISHRAAKLRTRVLVPNYSALTFPVARTVVRDAFIRAGQGASFNPDDIMFFTTRQMTYTMAVVGMMTRQKPAANFLVGHFYSESLILAETGASIGAVQIGATDAVSQLPFFITTCDYTLIGEELFAAGALLSEDPLARSTIAAHDLFKVAAAVMMIIAVVLWGLDAVGVGGAGDMATGLASLLKEGK